MNYQYNPYAAPQAPPPIAQGRLTSGSPQPWSVGEVISLGWQRFQQNWVVLVFSYLLVQVILQVVSRISSSVAVAALGPDVLAVGPSIDIFSSTQLIALSVSIVISQIVSAYFLPGLTRIWIAAARGETPSFGLLFTGYDRFLPMLALTILSGLLVGVGLFFLIVPGVILALALFMSQYYLVDAKMGPIAAMKASWNATSGQKADIFVLALAGIGLSIVGVLMCVIGVLATFPIYAVAAAAAYTRMSGIGVAPSTYAYGGPPGPQPGYPLPPAGYGPPPGYGPPSGGGGVGGPPGYGPPGG